MAVDGALSYLELFVSRHVPALKKIDRQPLGKELASNLDRPAHITTPRESGTTA